MEDKNIQIRMKKDNINTTIVLRLSVLDLYSEIFFNSGYEDNKKFINKQIKNLINPHSKNLSQLTSKFLLDCVKEEVKILKKRLLD